MESLAIETNPEVGAGYRAAEAELITLKAKESALRDRLDQVATEELRETPHPARKTSSRAW